MKRRFCFTLVEILVVTALVALLGVIGFAGYGYAMGAARRSATESLIKQIEAALENFKIKKGYYPSSSSYAVIGLALNSSNEITSVSFGGTSWANTSDEFKTFIKPLDQEKLKKNISGGNLVDSWGGNIYYRYPGVHNNTGFDLVAPGPDGKFSISNFDDGSSLPGNLETAIYKTNGDWACDDIANFMDK